MKRSKHVPVPVPTEGERYHSSMARSNFDTLDAEFQDQEGPFTEELRDKIQRGEATIHDSDGNDVRLGMGLFYTKDEWEKKREKILKTPLP